MLDTNSVKESVRFAFLKRQENEEENILESHDLRLDLVDLYEDVC